MRPLLMSLVWNLVAGTALSAPAKTLVLRGVEVKDASVKEGLTLSVEIECGEHMKGILVREDQDRVGIAVAVERPEVRCSAGSEIRELHIPFVDPKGRDIVALPTGLGDTKVVLQDAMLTSSGAAGLAVEWDNVCRPLLGVMLMPQADGTVAVAAGLVSGAAARKAKGVACEGGRKSTVLRSIHSSQMNWSVLNRPGKLEDLYAVRVIAPESVQIAADGKLSMSWQRRCREIALGVLFGEDSPSTVAIVTAYLPNVSCAGAKFLSETTTIDALTLASNSKIAGISKAQAAALNRKSSSFRLVAPEKVEFTGLKKDVVIQSSSLCGKRLGLVIGKDSIGNTAMAHLMETSTGVCNVKSTSTKSILPLRVSTSLSPRVFPLRVMGSIAH